MKKEGCANHKLQLKDQSLLKTQAYVNGEWIGARSGKTFEVYGPTEF